MRRGTFITISDHMSESLRPTPDSKTNELRTRTSLIDPALKRAGWNVKDATQVGLEIPVDGYDKEPWNGITDYCLYDASVSVLAVVEAKRFSRNPRDADAQLNH